MWVTDARTALLTTHETDEFARLRRALQETSDYDGRLFQFCILLAKYEAADECGERPVASARSSDVPRFSGPSRVRRSTRASPTTRRGSVSTVSGSLNLARSIESRTHRVRPTR